MILKTPLKLKSSAYQSYENLVITIYSGIEILEWKWNGI